jgi:hypothetical protein
MKLSLLFSTSFFLSSSHAWSPSKVSQEATRRSFVSSLVIGSGAVIRSTNASADDDESFASIAERASKISQAIQQEEAEQPSFGTTQKSADSRTAYDFSLPMAGTQTPFTDIVRNQDNAVKAILVVNIKQDDPVARRNIPELIALAAKYVELYRVLVFYRRINDSFYYIAIDKRSSNSTLL